MKLCMFSPREADLERGWPGRIEGDRVVQLAAQTLQSFFTGGGRAREHAEYRLDEIVLRAPVLHPPSIRLFSGTRFLFANPASIYGPDAVVPYPPETGALGLEARPTAVVGAEGATGGVTLMIAWTAPDLEPAKDRDFAQCLGPVVVTPDELDEPIQVVARVNGEERLRDAVWVPWDELVARAAANTTLVAGDLLGADGLTFREALQPGAVVEVEAEGIGVLRNLVAAG
jgi:2-keto-4-pentenoate hydratase/2-oxohepta-3-ene-1,7-dioic acid hydratase in catechol pathway